MGSHDLGAQAVLKTWMLGWGSGCHQGATKIKTDAAAAKVKMKRLVVE